MKFEKTILEGCYIITPRKFEDERGYFFESYNQKQFEENTNQSINFVQDNVSKSTYGVLRGLHYQKGEHAQAKLVSVSEGKVLDVAVDLRTNSKTYGKHVQVVLSEENNKQLFVPRGFAHGFVVLSEEAVFRYKCDNFYNKEAERGINYDKLGIDWKVDEKDIIINSRDKNFQFLENFIAD
jgi:dTDP-4-dehydrorhamnose 3,5-epimerase